MVWNAQGRKQRFKTSAWVRGDGLTQEGLPNAFGNYTYNSLADLAANRPASYQRTLTQPTRSATSYNGALAFSHQWNPNRWFSLLSGARVEGSMFGEAPPENAALRPELANSPRGLNAIAFATDSAAGAHTALAQAKFMPQPLKSLSRPVAIDDTVQDARFALVALPPETVDWGRLIVCEHLTRERVWRDGLRNHPNSAREITRITVVVPDPFTEASRLAPLFAESSMRPETERAELSLGHLRVDLVTAGLLQHRLGESACDGGGRASYMAAIELRCTSLDAVRTALRALPARGVHDQGSRVIVAAGLACNTTIEFIE
jgi:hypothetical protein